MKNIAIAAALFASLGTASSAATVLDFEDIVLSAAGQDFIPGVYTNQGFRLTGTGLFFSTNTSATGYPNGGSTSLAMAGPNETIVLERVDGAAFSMERIDLLPLQFSTGANIVFIGTLAGGSTVTSTSVILSSFTPITHSFDASFTDLEKVQWSQIAPYHQFDNIQLSVAAATLPAALPLLAVAPGGPGLASRRRKTA
jgi:hypothetical protein